MSEREGTAIKGVARPEARPTFKYDGGVEKRNQAEAEWGSGHPSGYWFIGCISFSMCLIPLFGLLFFDFNLIQSMYKLYIILVYHFRVQG
jgi:hypothetical protein